MTASCDYEKIAICHKRSVSFVRQSQLRTNLPPEVAVPAFPDITAWTIHATANTKAGVEVLRMTSNEADPEIEITDGINNIFVTTIPDDVMITFPVGILRFDYLFYDETGKRRATRTGYFNIEKEETIPVELP